MPRPHPPELRQRAVELTADLPDGLRRSLTWDQGREMAKWPDLQADADIDVFFCDPDSPWQRPSKEHMNALLRQYFPKGTDLNNVSLEQVRFVAAEMNGRPARCSAGGRRLRSTLTSLQRPPDRAWNHPPRRKGDRWRRDDPVLLVLCGVELTAQPVLGRILRRQVP